MQTFTAESDTRKAAWVSSGEMPSIISIGTKMVERIAHLEVAEVMRRLSMPVKMMMPSSEPADGMPRSLRNSAPEMASSVPMPDLPKT